MVDIYLRPGQAIPSDVALCDPTVPCNELVAWGWEFDPAVARSVPKARDTSESEPLPALPTVALTPWGWESGEPMRAPPARRARADAGEPLARLFAWGWEQDAARVRSATPRTRSELSDPIPPRSAWGWEQDAARVRSPGLRTRGDVSEPIPPPPAWGWDSESTRKAIAARAEGEASEPLAPLEALAPWGWEAPGPLQSITHRNVATRVEMALPALPAPPVPPAPPVAPSSSGGTGGGSGGGGTLQQPWRTKPNYVDQVELDAINDDVGEVFDEMEGFRPEPFEDYAQTPFQLEIPDWSIVPKKKPTPAMEMARSQRPTPAQSSPAPKGLSRAELAHWISFARFLRVLAKIFRE